MELKDFIAETLAQIVEGVRTAQSTPDGTNVNAAMAGIDFGGHLVNGGRHGVATRVDFDVSVSAETKAGGGAKLSVFGIGIDGGAGHTAAAANRISFSVPVRLPDGDAAREKAVHDEKEASWKAARTSRARRGYLDI